MARGGLPLKSCVFERASRRYECEVAEARADRASCGFLIKIATSNGATKAVGGKDKKKAGLAFPSRSSGAPHSGQAKGNTEGRKQWQHSGDSRKAASPFLLSAAISRKTTCPCEQLTSGHPPRAPTNGRPGFPFGFLGAGGRLPKARRGRAGFYCEILLLPCEQVTWKCGFTPSCRLLSFPARCAC